MPNQNISPQITDAVTQTNVKVVAEAPAMPMNSMYQIAAHSAGIMFENAINAQNQQNMTNQAATTQGSTQSCCGDTIADAIAAARMLEASRK